MLLLHHQTPPPLPTSNLHGLNCLSILMLLLHHQTPPPPHLQPTWVELSISIDVVAGPPDPPPPPHLQPTWVELSINIDVVTSPPDPPNLQVVHINGQKVKKARLTEGANVTVTCQFDSNPAPSVRWFRERDADVILLKENLEDQRPLVSVERGVTRNTYTSQFVQHSVQCSDTGVYICTASNVLGSGLDGEFQLDVVCELLSSSSSSSFSSLSSSSSSSFSSLSSSSSSSFLSLSSSSSSSSYNNSSSNNNDNNNNNSNNTTDNNDDDNNDNINNDDDDNNDNNNNNQIKRRN